MTTFVKAVRDVLGLLYSGRKAVVRFTGGRTRFTIYPAIDGTAVPQQVRRKVWTFLHRMEWVKINKELKPGYEVVATPLGINTYLNRIDGNEPGFAHRQMEIGAEPVSVRARTLIEMAHSDVIAVEQMQLQEDLKILTSTILTAWDVVRLCVAANFDPQYVVCGVSPHRNLALLLGWKPPPFNIWKRECRRRIRDAMTTLWVRHQHVSSDRRVGHIGAMNPVTISCFWDGSLTNARLVDMTALCMAGRFDATYLWTGLRLDVPKKYL